MIYLNNAILHAPAETINPGVMIIRGDKVLALGPAIELPCPAGAQSIDLGGMSLVPGFIDLQINGAFGMDFSSSPESIWKVGERLTNYGVTSFLPTIVSSPPEVIHHAQDVLRQGPPTGYRGARALGLHLEVPYLNPGKPGAHNPAYLRLPDKNEYSRWSPANHVRLVTLAPELDGAIPAIQHLVQNNVVVSAGHSLATLEQAQAGFEAGIRYATHLFNAMAHLDHRHLGLVGAILDDPRLIAGMILDGVHLHPGVVNLIWKALGSQRINLVTDSMAAHGMPPGEYPLGEVTVFVDTASAHLEDGRLAGSLLSLDQALHNLIKFTGCSLFESIKTITQVPAHLLHLDANLGRLSAGSKADFVLLSPEKQVVGVWIDGRQVFPTAA